MKFIDLFAGIGGFRVGLEQSGHQCVWSCENDKFARRVYRYHWEEPAGDITQIRTSDIPDHDILCGGFPCQDFSIAGKRKGIEGTRGTLFYEIARILDDKRPSYLFLENVKGLLSSRGGWDFAIILSVLDELGYDLQWQVLNSKYFGVPQSRPRVFIIGHLRGKPRPEVFPFREDGQVYIDKDATRGRSEQALISRTIKTRTRASDTFLVQKLYGGYNEEAVRQFRDIAPTLTTPTGGGLLPHVVNKLEDGYSIRQFTPIECERMQGFSDNWTKWGIDEKGKKVIISDRQRRKMCGNAVTTTVVRDVGRKAFGEA